MLFTLELLRQAGLLNDPVGGGDMSLGNGAKPNLVVTLAGSYPIAAVVFKDFHYVAGPTLAAIIRAAAAALPLKLGLDYLDWRWARLAGSW
jgi:hypothetical protein